MDARPAWVREEPTDKLVTSLVGEVRAYARAEIDLYKAIARYRAAKAKNGAIELTAGAVMLWFAGMALLFGCVLALATLIGPLASGLLIAGALGAAGYLLVRSGAPKLGALSGDAEEAVARTGKDLGDER